MALLEADMTPKRATTLRLRIPGCPAKASIISWTMYGTLVTMNAPNTTTVIFRVFTCEQYGVVKLVPTEKARYREVPSVRTQRKKNICIPILYSFSLRDN